MVPKNNNADFKLDQLFNVKDKVALVTGGGSGIGLMATQALAVNGAKVYIVGRTEEKLETVVENFGKDIDGQIIPIAADISQKDEIKRLVKEIESREKCLCILINNAGISSSNQLPQGESAEELKKNLFDPDNATFEDWETTYRTNVPQLYFMTTAFLPLLQKATENQHGYSGCVVNIGSISGMVQTAQNHFAYNASKGAAHHLTKLLASEITSQGIKIRINAIAPGVFPSEMTAHESADNQKSELPKSKKSELPASRPGNDRDMGNAILFAVTNQYLNGQIVAVDGGYLLSAGT
ncbi:putative short chain dehydrogenase reductase family [Phaeomoniella chlamydospora]|uniref:Putative short chain dehydrogenase reductase family n=1 Tax=Phaeomoniella chlamydospora TaxID=158046 RepID=A0A0G2EQR9_PHACM|nr:putative short chain dehydrogenase reductase family [Phaeomoniella chlamydospora]